MCGLKKAHQSARTRKKLVAKKRFKNKKYKKKYVKTLNVYCLKNPHLI